VDFRHDFEVDSVMQRRDSAMPSPSIAIFMSRRPARFSKL
jgi:hypothetical protein